MYRGYLDSISELVAGFLLDAGGIVPINVALFAVLGGVPGRVIKYRFSDSEIEKLKKLKWWEKDWSWIVNNSCHFNNICNIDILESK